MLKEFHHQLACIYIEKGKWKEALNHVELYINHMEDIPDKSGMLVTALTVYSQLKDSSKIVFCQENILKYGNVFAKQNTIGNIILARSKALKEKEIANLITNYKEYTDSIIKENNATAIKKAEQLYNYELKENENKYLRSINLTEMVGLIMVIAIAILIVFYLKLKNISTYQQQKILELKLDKYKNLQRKEEKKATDKIEKETNSIKCSDIYKYSNFRNTII